MKQELSSPSRALLVRPVGAERHILLCEDNDDMRVLLLFALGSRGYRVTTCGDGVSLLKCLDECGTSGAQPFDLIVTDVRMPRLNGIEALEFAAENAPLPPVIVITAFADEATHRRAERLGAAATYDKPFDPDDLVAHIGEILTDGFESR